MLSGSPGTLIAFVAADAGAGKSARQKLAKKKRKARQRVNACFVALSDDRDDYTGDLFI